MVERCDRSMAEHPEITCDKISGKSTRHSSQCLWRIREFQWESQGDRDTACQDNSYPSPAQTQQIPSAERNFNIFSHYRENFSSIGASWPHFQISVQTKIFDKFLLFNFLTFRLRFESLSESSDPTEGSDGSNFFRIVGEGVQVSLRQKDLLGLYRTLTRITLACVRYSDEILEFQQSHFWGFWRFRPCWLSTVLRAPGLGSAVRFFTGDRYPWQTPTFGIPYGRAQFWNFPEAPYQGYFKQNFRKKPKLKKW